MNHRPEGERHDVSRATDAQPPVASRGRRFGCLPLVAAAGVWFWLLRDFTDTPITSVLTVLGVGLAYSGTYLTVGGGRHAFESLWYAGACGAGLVLLASAAATLAPAAPDHLLVRIAQGWNVLEDRTRRLAAAIEAKDVALARKLAARGTGDRTAPDEQGDPVLHRARSAEMISALLSAGLDPDAADATGRTLLMQTSDLEVARTLLAGGADPNARDDTGFTALMHRADDAPEMIGLLVEAGADVHAVNDSGRTVADFVRGAARPLLERHAGGRPLAETGEVTPHGREDWLVATPGPDGRPDASAVSLVGEPLRPGEVGVVSIVVDNPGPGDRVLDVRAVLDNGVFFVAASHEGRVETRGPPGPTSTVRWPLLSLPAGGQGRLELRILARPDEAVAGLRPEALGIDVALIDLPERSQRVLQLSQSHAGSPSRLAASDPRAYVGVLVFAGAVFILWLLYRVRARGDSRSDRRYRLARLAAGGAALLCAAVAIGLAWSLAEPYVRFEDASCEILDRRALAREVQPSTQPVRQRRHVTWQAHPVAAVSIDAGAERVVTAGWAIGASTRSVQELRAAAIGSTLRCWIDPNDPHRFTVVRTPPLAGLVGIVMLAGLTAVLGLIAARLGGSGTADAGGRS